MVTEANLRLADGRTLRYYDSGSPDSVAVFWNHGTPNVGSPPEPLFAAAAGHGVRWMSYDRPGYGGSSPQPELAAQSPGAALRVTADDGHITVLDHVPAALAWLSGHAS